MYSYDNQLGEANGQDFGTNARRSRGIDKWMLAGASSSQLEASPVVDRGAPSSLFISCKALTHANFIMIYLSACIPLCCRSSRTREVSSRPQGGRGAVRCGVEIHILKQ